MDQSCKRPTQAVSPRPIESPETNYESAPVPFDVCALLKPEEIRAITGALIIERKSSGRSNGRFRVSQCVYVASQPDQSVSLVVTQTDPYAPQEGNPKDFWREKFGRYREQTAEEEGEAKEKREEGKEREEGRPPRRIEGLGDEAFWTAGSLYVLQKDLFLRVSLGGSTLEETKLEHAKALAALALKGL